jgi:hypothetical protein
MRTKFTFALIYQGEIEAPVLITDSKEQGQKERRKSNFAY